MLMCVLELCKSSISAKKHTIWRASIDILLTLCLIFLLITALYPLMPLQWKKKCVFHYEKSMHLSFSLTKLRIGTLSVTQPFKTFYCSQILHFLPLPCDSKGFWPLGH